MMGVMTIYAVRIIIIIIAFAEGWASKRDIHDILFCVLCEKKGEVCAAPYKTSCLCFSHV